MAIELIDKIKQKNNGGFKLVDAVDVDWDGTGEKSVKGKVEAITTGEIDDILSQ